MKLTGGSTFLQLPAAVLFVAAQFVYPSSEQFVPPASYDKVLKSPLSSNVTISYKVPPKGTCMTAFASQKQYSGYINLPPYTLAPIQQDYSINTFFWFVEARQHPETAPLTIWLQGGPGTSSMFGMFNEVGPCEVVQMADGRYGTQINNWGWDRSSNMLFIDQPNQVGFSFDTAKNVSFNLLTGNVFEPPRPLGDRLPDYMYLNGTFGTASSNSANSRHNTANTTQIAAQATWHFLQSWLSAFPQYNPTVRTNVTSSSSSAIDPVGINLFTESYGGHYGPAFAAYFEAQNQARLNGTLSNSSTLAIKLETVGIMNGMIDDLVQFNYYPLFAYNNTYGIQAINQVDELNDLNDYTNVCLPYIRQCRAAMAQTDPEGHGDVASTNALCLRATDICNRLMAAYQAAGYNLYDIRQKMPSPDPPAAYQEYLNYWSVLSAIGAQVNYTQSSPYVLDDFIATGDWLRGGLIEDLAYLLSIGVRVALIYGDADYICNWFGGEAVSFAIADSMSKYRAPRRGAFPQFLYAEGFPAAGYADIVVNDTYVGGVARQFGNLSFSRIYDAGHFVPYFQPETAFTLFARIIEGTDLSTGDVINLSNFGSTGPANATYTQSASYSPSPTCWVRAWPSTCSDDETKAMHEGKGIVAHGIFYQDNKDTDSGLPGSIVSAGRPGHPVKTVTGTAKGLTGVYTATGTPKQSSGSAAAFAQQTHSEIRLLPFVVLLVSFAIGSGLVL